MSIFELSVEATPMPGNSESQNAWVYVYLNESDLEAAILAMKEVLAKDLYEVCDIEHVVRLDLSEYRPRDENFPDRDSLEQLQAGESAYGPFFRIL